MALTLTDIKLLKAATAVEIDSAQRIVEAKQKDIEALERIEAILRAEGRTTSKARAHGAPKTRAKAADIGNAPPSNNNGSGRDLRGMVLAVLHEARVAGEYLRPREIVERCKAGGYPFVSDRNAMGSVTKVLTRLLRKSLIERTTEGYTGM